jgi:RNA polymerase sigma-70 factor (ECF subfamily)
VQEVTGSGATPGEVDISVGSERTGGRTFDEFFRETSRALLGQAFLLTGDLGDAHDLVQEVMWRAWRDWSKVSTYEVPEAWARQVLHHLAIGRWRRLRVSKRYAARQGVIALPPPPDADHLDVARALNALPVDQRRAIVLHDFGDLSVADVANELSVPVGTVKSWLSRGRAALAVSLGIDSDTTGEK